MILGLGITFELPILIMFLSLFGIVSPKFLWKNFRYAILLIFIIAAIITPTSDVLTMCVFRQPHAGALRARHRRLLVGASRHAQTTRRKGGRVRRSLLVAILFTAAPPPARRDLPQFDGARALEYTRQFVAIGPRWLGSPGHVKAEAFIRDQFRHDQLEEDTFTAKTSVGPETMHNFIVKFPGKKDGIIVLASHYETNYPLRNIHLRRRQRRRLDHRPADRDGQLICAANPMTATACGWSSPTAKRRSRAWTDNDALWARAIWLRNGRPTAR